MKIRQSLCRYPVTHGPHTTKLNMVNIMLADVLAANADRASAGIILNSPKHLYIQAQHPRFNALCHLLMNGRP